MDDKKNVNENEGLSDIYLNDMARHGKAAVIIYYDNDDNMMRLLTNTRDHVAKMMIDDAYKHLIEEKSGNIEEKKG